MTVSCLPGVLLVAAGGYFVFFSRWITQRNIAFAERVTIGNRGESVMAVVFFALGISMVGIAGIMLLNTRLALAPTTSIVGLAGVILIALAHNLAKAVRLFLAESFRVQSVLLPFLYPVIGVLCVILGIVLLAHPPK
jgi:hypothetical protein